MAGADARIDVEYRAIGNLAGPLNEARQGLSKLGESYDQLKRKAEAAEAEASRSASATGKRAVRMGNETAARNYITRGMSEAGGRTSGREMMARGMHEMGREYRVHQEVERLAQADAALRARKREILTSNTVSGSAPDLQLADRVDPTSMSMRQHYRALEGRQRQERLDAMQDQQMQDADARAGRASRASRRQRRELREMFGPQGDGMPDLAGLSGGIAERRLTTPGLMYRGAPAERGSGMMAGMRQRMDGMGVSRSLQYGANIIGFGGITSAVYGWQKSNRDMIEKADEAATGYDTLARSLQVQAGFESPLANSEALKRVDSIAQNAAMTKEFTYAAATQLVSSGFSAEEATGQSLVEMLKGINAMPAPGGQKVDPVKMAEASAAYLTSQGMEKTSENLKSVMGGVQGLYKFTNFQLEDFTQFAREAPAFKNRVTMSEQFSAFSILRDVGNSAEEASQVMRNVALRTETAGAYPEKVEALASIGLTPQDIDMSGESFITVLDRFAKALEGKDGPTQSEVLKKVFEERAVPGIKQLIEDRGKVQDRAALVGDVSRYEADAALMSSGPEAAKRKQTLRSEAFLKEKADYDSLLREQMAQNSLERGESAARVALRKLEYDTYRAMGQSQETAGAAAFGDYGIGVGGAERVSSARKELGDMGVRSNGGIRNFLQEEARRSLIADGHSAEPNNAFDHSGKSVIGAPTNVIPRTDAEIRAENKRFDQEQEDKRNAGLIAPRAPVGGQQQLDREDMLRQIRDAIREQKPVVVIKGNDRNAPVNIPLLRLGAGMMTGIR